MKSITRKIFRQRNSFTKWVNSYAVKINKYYENLDYNNETNGELRVLQRLRDSEETIRCIMDVGANSGEWALVSSEVFPDAEIYSFEIIPDTFKKFKEQTGAKHNIKGFNFGLSDKNEELTAFYHADRSELATCVAGHSENFHRFDPQIIDVSVKKGDDFCKENAIGSIDFLKIDVEGFENKVLAGFEGMLGKGSIKILQFEYGTININTHFLLKDFYEYLENFGMVVGKIYPNFVDFREYRYADENFYGPNYLAVHSSYRSTIESLG